MQSELATAVTKMEKIDIDKDEKDQLMELDKKLASLTTKDKESIAVKKNKKGGKKVGNRRRLAF